MRVARGDGGIHTWQQRLDRPWRLVVDLFEIGPAGHAADHPETAAAHRAPAT